ncbi:MAG: NYN domain-containing protein [Chloroflexi bacterium]|nr:NYN domain-containing protein [Chloroflexota bacterium]
MPKAKRVLLAVDAANHAIDAKENGARVNYGASLSYAAHHGMIKQAGFYGVRCNGVGEKERQQLIALKQAGFNRMVVRPLRQRADGTNKSDIDTVIAMDVWEAVVKKEADIVVLLSGDSDFVPLVERLVERGVEVHVIGPDRGTAWELAIAATHFLYASQLDGLVQSGSVNGAQVGDRPLPESERPAREAATASSNGNGTGLPAALKPGV